MLDSIFTGFAPTLSQVAAVLGSALLCGIIIAASYRLITKKPSRNMMVTLIILPAIVQALIMLVNGSIGTGIAIVGAFSLVRFRSVPGNSKDICVLFMAMTSGIAAGVGYAIYAIVFTIALCVVMTLAEKLIPENIGAKTRVLKIHLPENMDFEGVFDDILKEYTQKFSMEYVKTVNMGTMYEVVYSVTLSETAKEKEMLDKIRCRNGNLTVSCGALPYKNEEI